MSKQKTDGQIPISKRPAVSVAALSEAATLASADDILPDLSASDPEPKASDDQAEEAVSSAKTESSASVDLPEEAVLFVYEPKCLNCSHLVAFAEKANHGCHFTSGNEDCPAQSVTITVRLPMTKIIRNFLRAEEDGDTEKLGRLYGSLSKKPEWAKRQIMTALQEARDRASTK